MLPFDHCLNESRNFALRTQKTKFKQKIVHNNAINLYNTLLTIYFNQYNNITNKEKEHMDKNMTSEFYLLQVVTLMFGRKSMKKKEETIAKRAGRNYC